MDAKNKIVKEHLNSALKITAIADKHATEGLNESKDLLHHMAAIVSENEDFWNELTEAKWMVDEFTTMMFRIKNFRNELAQRYGSYED